MIYIDKKRLYIDIYTCFLLARDGDGVLDEFDNCPDLPNGEQADADGDKKGDLNQNNLVRD